MSGIVYLCAWAFCIFALLFMAWEKAKNREDRQRRQAGDMNQDERTAGVAR